MESEDATEYDGDTLPGGNAFATAIGGGAGLSISSILLFAGIKLKSISMLGDDGGGGARMRLERLAAQFAESLRAAAVRAGAGIHSYQFFSFFFLTNIEMPFLFKRYCVGVGWCRFAGQ